ncbi:hypothetical protein JCM11641_004104 [Rhodosporidiobolus odoratus]
MSFEPAFPDSPISNRRSPSPSPTRSGPSRELLAHHSPSFIDAAAEEGELREHLQPPQQPQPDSLDQPNALAHSDIGEDEDMHSSVVESNGEHEVLECHASEGGPAPGQLAMNVDDDERLERCPSRLSYVLRSPNPVKNAGECSTARTFLHISQKRDDFFHGCSLLASFSPAPPPHLEAYRYELVLPLREIGARLLKVPNKRRDITQAANMAHLKVYFRDDGRSELDMVGTPGAINRLLSLLRDFVYVELKDHWRDFDWPRIQDERWCTFFDNRCKLLTRFALQERWADEPSGPRPPTMSTGPRVPYPPRGQGPPPSHRRSIADTLPPTPTVACTLRGAGLPDSSRRRSLSYASSREGYHRQRDERSLSPPPQRRNSTLSRVNPHREFGAEHPERPSTNESWSSGWRSSFRGHSEDGKARSISRERLSSSDRFGDHDTSKGSSRRRLPAVPPQPQAARRRDNRSSFIAKSDSRSRGPSQTRHGESRPRRHAPHQPTLQQPSTTSHFNRCSAKFQPEAVGKRPERKMPPVPIGEGDGKRVYKLDIPSSVAGEFVGDQSVVPFIERVARVAVGLVFSSKEGCKLIFKFVRDEQLLDAVQEVQRVIRLKEPAWTAPRPAFLTPLSSSPTNYRHSGGFRETPPSPPRPALTAQALRHNIDSGFPSTSHRVTNPSHIGSSVGPSTLPGRKQQPAFVPSRTNTPGSHPDDGHGAQSAGLDHEEALRREVEASFMRMKRAKAGYGRTLPAAQEDVVDGQGGAMEGGENPAFHASPLSLNYGPYSGHLNPAFAPSNVVYNPPATSSTSASVNPSFSPATKLASGAHNRVPTGPRNQSPNFQRLGGVKGGRSGGVLGRPQWGRGGFRSMPM